MYKKFANVFAGGAVILFAAVIYIATFQIRVLAALSETTDARFFPRLAAIAIALLGAIILLRGIKTVLDSPKVDHQKGRVTISEGALCVIQTLLCLAAYIFLMGTAGFLIATALYVFVQILILIPRGEKKNYLLFAIISVLCSVSVYFIFTKIFYLMLPVGILG